MMKLIYATIFILFMSCDLKLIDRKPLSKYPGWVVIDKTYYSGPSYRITIQKNDSIKQILTYEYYFKHYHLGDTIK